MSNFPVVVEVATQTNYPAGPGLWAGLATKVAPGGAFTNYGFAPAGGVSAEEWNYWADRQNALYKDARAVVYTRKLTSKILAVSNSVPMPFPAQGCFGVLIVSGSLLIQRLSPDFERSTNGSTSGSFVDKLTLVDYAPASGVGNYGACYALSSDSAQQGTLLTVDENNAQTPHFDTGVPSPTSGQWIDVCTQIDGLVCLLDSGGTRLKSLLGWTGYAAFTGTDWICLAKKPALANQTAPMFAFSPTHTAQTALGSSSFSTSAATWDGLAIPAGHSMLCPVWDFVNGQWLVCTADLSSGANARSSAKLWTSTDGIEWGTLGALPFVMIRAVCHRGAIYALGMLPDGASFTGTNNGALEAFVSFDGGATWVRPGYVVSFIGSLTASTLRLKTRIAALNGAIALSSTINGQLETVVIGNGSQ